MNISIAVISDLNTDQRVQKTAATLQNHVGNVTVICRNIDGSSDHFPFTVKRLDLILKGGILFYAWFNIRLFFKLLVQPSDIIVANDADTLLPCFYASKLKGSKLVFDSHEIMSEVPEVISRPRVQNVWKWIEKRFIPRVTYKYTVCDSLKAYYNSGFEVIRNVPYAYDSPVKDSDNGEKMILYQGSVNMDRGIETMIEAMPYINNAVFVIVGDGYQIDEIKALAKQSPVSDRIVFKGKMKPETLRVFTMLADLGISIEENKGLNYYYALPNKLMDYIQAGVPVLVSDFPEMRNIIDTYKVGECLVSREPKKLAEQVNLLFENTKRYQGWKKNTKKASKDLCWENEEKKLLELYKNIMSS